MERYQTEFAVPTESYSTLEEVLKAGVNRRQIPYQHLSLLSRVGDRASVGTMS